VKYKNINIAPDSIELISKKKRLEIFVFDYNSFGSSNLIF